MGQHKRRAVEDALIAEWDGPETYASLGARFGLAHETIRSVAVKMMRAGRLANPRPPHRDRNPGQFKAQVDARRDPLLGGSYEGTYWELKEREYRTKARESHEHLKDDPDYRAAMADEAQAILAMVRPIVRRRSA
jgi:hypothetical protein